MVVSKYFIKMHPICTHFLDSARGGTPERRAGLFSALAVKIKLQSTDFNYKAT